MSSDSKSTADQGHQGQGRISRAMSWLWSWFSAAEYAEVERSSESTSNDTLLKQRSDKGKRESEPEPGKAVDETALLDFDEIDEDRSFRERKDVEEHEDLVFALASQEAPAKPEPDSVVEPEKPVSLGEKPHHAVLQKDTTTPQELVEAETPSEIAKSGVENVKLKEGREKEESEIKLQETPGKPVWEEPEAAKHLPAEVQLKDAEPESKSGSDQAEVIQNRDKEHAAESFPNNPLADAVKEAEESSELEEQLVKQMNELNASNAELTVGLAQLTSAADAQISCSEASSTSLHESIDKSIEKSGNQPSIVTPPTTKSTTGQASGYLVEY